MALCTDPFSSDVFGKGGAVPFRCPADPFPFQFPFVPERDIIAFIRLTAEDSGSVLIDINAGIIRNFGRAILLFSLILDGTVPFYLGRRLCLFSVCHLAPPWILLTSC